MNRHGTSQSVAHPYRSVRRLAPSCRSVSCGIPPSSRSSLRTRRSVRSAVAATRYARSPSHVVDPYTRIARGQSRRVHRTLPTHHPPGRRPARCTRPIAFRAVRVSGGYACHPSTVSPVDTRGRGCDTQACSGRRSRRERRHRPARERVGRRQRAINDDMRAIICPHTAGVNDYARRVAESAPTG